MAQWLHASGGDVNAPRWKEPASTPLQSAAADLHADVVEWLLGVGARGRAELG